MEIAVSDAGVLLKCSDCGSTEVLTYPESNRDAARGAFGNGEPRTQVSALGSALSVPYLSTRTLVLSAQHPERTFELVSVS